jgi:predicted lipoprotein with Yx(FWY)xxD motif
MTRSISTRAVARATVVALIVLGVAACGSSGSSSTSATTTPPKTTDGAPATLGVANTDLGRILVNTQGRTLYLFKKDTSTKSTCTGACAAAWPPLRVTGKPTVGRGTNATMLATSKRSDGNPQVTDNGHPLYLYTGDQKPGDTNGQGLNAFGGGWFAVSPSGDQVSGQGSNSGANNGY